MTNRPIHKNLDTSFVNLSALIKYLRRRQFVGNIRIELTGYEADVVLTAENQMRVREYDRIAGRISEGEEALQRLLIRAREPGGSIDVYQEAEEIAPTAEKSTEPAQVEETLLLKDAMASEEDSITAESFAPPVEKAAPPSKTSSPHKAESAVETFVPKPPHKNGNSHKSSVETTVAENKPSSPNTNLPPLAFELSNRVENKAKTPTLAPQDWQMLLNLTAELLSTIDATLAEANLEFTAAFEKARAEIADDYPFLNPSAGIFTYKNGKIIVREQINTKLFVASINEALRRILEKLGKNPKFLNVYLTTVQKILLLIEKRRPIYNKFSITPQLSKIIGV